MIGLRGQVIVAVIALLGSATAGWQINGWRLTSHFNKMQVHNDQLLIERMKIQREAFEGLLKKEQGKNADYLKRLASLEVENERLADDVLSGAIRLSVPVKAGTKCLPAAVGDPGQSVGEGRAELDPTAAVRILRIPEEGDRRIMQLNELIDRVKGQME